MMNQLTPQMLQMLMSMSGGQQGGAGQQNNAPQIPVAQQRTQSNIAPTPQQPQQPAASPGGALGGATSAATNVQKLYGMGNSMFGNAPNLTGQAAQGMPGSMGAPIANNSAGAAYAGQNPWTMGQASNAGIGTGIGQSGGMSQAMPFMQPGSGGMFGAQGATGGGGAGSLFGASAPSMAAGAGVAGGPGAAGASADGTAASGMFGSVGAGGAGTAAAADSSPSWLSALMAFL